MTHRFLFQVPLAVAFCAIMTMAACDGDVAGNNSEDDVKSVMGAICVMNDGNVFLEDKGGEVVAFCGAYEDGWSCRDGLCEQHLETIQGRIASALVVGETQVNPLTKSRGPCVPLTLVACCSESDGCTMPDGSPYLGRWICAPEFIDEFGWVHTSAESMPCGAGQECAEEGVFPNVGLCQDIPSCVTNADCGDMDPCVDKECIGGKCVFTEKIGEACNDGDSCTLADTCVVTSPTDTTLVCVGTAKNCDDGNECTQDACDAATGECGHTNVADGTACDDDLACTLADVCVAGICAGTAKNCDDGNECTQDACDAATGACLNEAVADSTACDDSNACTTEDACEAGECMGVQTNCDDSNACTSDSCNSETGACVNTPVADGTSCGEADICVAGACVTDWCTVGDADQCCIKPAVEQNQVGVCECRAIDDSEYGTWSIKTSCGYYEDGDYCFNNAQEVPTCSGACVPVCDGKVCGSDGCGGSCGICSTGEFCSTAGQCHECLADANCDDSNTCTTDTCAASACQHLPVADHTVCGTNMECMAGECAVVVPSQCDATHICPVGQFCGGGTCYEIVDLHGLTGAGQSGANGGNPDGRPDNWDWDGDCYCAALPCLGTVVPVVSCLTLFGGDCDENTTPGTGYNNHPGANDWPNDNYDNDCNGTRACDALFPKCNVGESCVNGFCTVQ